MGPDAEVRLRIMDEKHPLRAFIRNKWHDWVATWLEDPNVLQLTQRLFEPHHIHTLKSWIAECCTSNTLGTMLRIKKAPKSIVQMMEWMESVDSFTACNISALLGFDGICQRLLDGEYEADDIHPEGIFPPILMCILSPFILIEYAVFLVREDATNVSLLCRLERTALLLMKHGPQIAPGTTWLHPRILDLLILYQFKTLIQHALEGGEICDRSNLKLLEESLQQGGDVAAFARTILKIMSNEHVRPVDEELLTNLQAAAESQNNQLSVSERNIPAPSDMDAPENALIEAVKSDDLAKLLSLLESSQNAQSWRDKSDCGLLDIAIYHNAFQVAKCLIAEGLPVNVPNNPSGIPPLHVAARTLRARFIELLCDNGADITRIDKEGCNIYHAISGSSPNTTRGSRELQTCMEVTEAKVPRGQLGIMIDKCNNGGLCPLSKAIRCCNVDAVRALLDMGADEWAVGPQGQTMIHHAAASGSLILVRLFLKRGHNPSAKDDEGAVALAHAAVVEDPDDQTFLSLYHASPECLLTSDRNLQTPLDILFEARGGLDGCEYPDAFKEILRRLVESILPEASTPLFQHLASCCSHRMPWFDAAAKWLEEAAEWLEHLEGRGLGQLDLSGIAGDLTRLLDRLQECYDEADTDECKAIARVVCPMIRCLPENSLRAIRSRGKQILSVAIATDSENIALAILDSYVDIETPDDDDDDALTPLQIMSKSWTPPSVAQKILSAAGDLSSTPPLPSGRSLLASAVQYAPLFIITALVRGGQDVNCLEKTDLTPLMAVARRAKHDILEVFDFLLSEGADPRLKDRDGFTAAHDAACFGKLAILKRLEKEKHCWKDKCMFKAHGGEFEPWSLLQLAAFRGHVKVVKYLLDLDLFDLDDKVGDLSLLDVAALGGSSSVVSYLVKLDHVWTESTDSSTSLHHAMASGSIPTVKLLLRNNYDLNARRNDGVSPLSLAMRDHRTEMMTLIEDYVQCKCSFHHPNAIDMSQSPTRAMMRHTRGVLTGRQNI